MRKGTNLVVRLVLIVFMLALAACGSNGVMSTFSDAGEGGTGPRGDAKAHDATGLGHDTGVLHGGDDGGMGAGMLSITPKNPVLAISNTSVPEQMFKAELAQGGTSQPVTANWTLSSFAIGNLSSTGDFTPKGTVAGTAVVTATYGSLMATTNVTVTVSLSTNLTDVTLPDGTVINESSVSITQADLTALNGAPTSEEGGATTIIYPYDGTVFPLGLLAPVAQFTPGSVPPVDFKISLDTTGFHWDGFGHIGNPAALQATIPQAVWDGALATATGGAAPVPVVLSVVKAANGVAYGPAKTNLTIANGKLTGVIYFESYSTDPIDAGADAAGATDFGLWAVKPGQTQPPAHLQLGCVICHGVSASGNTLTNGTDDPTIGDQTGVFRVEADGTYTHLATAPPNLPYAIAGGTDSRGIGWGTVSPDGTVLLRSATQFWGGDALLAWAVPPQPLLSGGVVQPLTTTMTVNGDFNMFVPEYSVDGKHLVYVTATNTDGGAPGTVSQSIGMVDIATQLGDGGGGSFGAVTLTNPRTLYDSAKTDAGGAGTFTKVPTFLPDSQSIVFEETKQSYTPYDHMLPDYMGQATVQLPGVDGELAMLQPNASGGYVRVALANANAGYDPTSPTENYEPKPLPVEVGGYYWVVFASRRADAYPTVPTPKKLWVTAISAGGAVGADPSHPPFTLVNQAIVAPQATQRAYWALAPCLGTGAGCQSNNDCCNASCIAGDGGALECLAPSMMTCANLGGRCAAGQDQDCCGVSAGVKCIGTLNGFGTCNAPGPPP
jgi:hypothetical protein